jgi:virulence-associated protein VapD
VCAKGTAQTDLAVVANSSAVAFSDAVAEAGSEGFGKAKASVYVEGTSIDTVSSHLTAIAKSWAFASVDASVKTFASVATGIINESFARVCILKHNEICSKRTGNFGKGACKLPARKACTSAYAYGEAFGNALSNGLAEAYLEAFTKSATIAILKADVDLTTTPKLKWKSTRGGAEVSCPK